jgi:hypothetical protein
MKFYTINILLALVSYIHGWYSSTSLYFNQYFSKVEYKIDFKNDGIHYLTQDEKLAVNIFINEPFTFEESHYNLAFNQIIDIQFIRLEEEINSFNVNIILTDFSAIRHYNVRMDDVQNIIVSLQTNKPQLRTSI